MAITLKRLQISTTLLLICFSTFAYGKRVVPRIAQGPEIIRRADFPVDFLFGASTSAIQIEGSADCEGKGQNIWDAYTGLNKTMVLDGSNMTYAIDSYKRFKEDLEHLKKLGVNAYRFSISWARILPDGSLSGGVNEQGIYHYNQIIDILLQYGIKPVVTLHHFDLPYGLEVKYGGLLDKSVVNDFKDYADICFGTFGDRVKTWITINEPSVVSQLGYDMGLSPPRRCSDRTHCSAGNSSIEPYTVAHNLLLSHAAVTQLYKEKYQAEQKGEIGITLVGQYYEPYSNCDEDKAAQERIMDFSLGWYLEPLVSGDYPSIMRQIAKDRLPIFTPEEKVMMKGAYDFIGINYYTSLYAIGVPIDPIVAPISYTHDQFVNTTAMGKNGRFIGPKVTGNADIYVYPDGLQKVLELIKDKYQNPKIYITENGVTELRNDSLPLVNALYDSHRIYYIQQHLHRVNQAMKNGVNVNGYFYWSLFDSFEWWGGYTTRFGLYFTNFNNNFERIPKLSALWLYNFMRGK